MEYKKNNLYIILKYRNSINVFSLLVTQYSTKFQIDLHIRSLWEPVCADL